MLLRKSLTRQQPELFFSFLTRCHANLYPGVISSFYSNTTRTSPSLYTIQMFHANLFQYPALYIVGTRRQANIMIVEAIYYLKRILFRLRWLIMSDRERYTYLWNRTRDSLQGCSRWEVSLRIYLTLNYGKSVCGILWLEVTRRD